MADLKLGIDLQDLRMDAKSALRQAAALQFRHIEVPAGHGETTPENLSPSGRRHLQKLVADLGLSMAALTGDFPGLRLSDPRTVDERVERTGAVLELAADLRVPVVTTAVGALTHPQSGEPSSIAIAALQRLGEIADARDRVLAIRPSHDSVERLAAVLDAIRCPRLRIGLDPAALIMSGVNPHGILERLGPQVVLVHMRDGLRGQPDRPGQEVALGQGEVDVRGLVEMLRDLEFQGPAILRRTDTSNPQTELSSSRDLVRRYLSK